MGFLNTDSMPRLVEKLSDGDNIKITGNSKGNRVGTVVKKIVEKADDVTKAIEQEVVNDSYSFKVGTGDVDVSADVEDGFGEVGVKGVTYQNLITNPSRIIRTIDQTGIKYKHFYALGKQNTVYTVILDVYKNTTTSDASNWGIYIDGANYSQDTFIGNTSIGLTKAGFVGRHISKITSNKNTSCTRFSIGMHSDYGSSYEFEADVVLLEGDHTNNPNLPSYFEEIVGVGDKSKNLFDKSSIILNTSIQDGVWVSSSDRFVSGYISAKPNTTYCCNQTFNNLYCFDKDKKWLGKCPYSDKKMTTLKNTSFIIANYVTSTTNIETLQIEEGSIATTYEPYHDGYKIEILSNGKNLYNIHNDIALTYGISKIEEGTITTNALVNYGTFGLVNSLHNVNSRIFDKPTKIVKGKKYSISCKVRKVSGEGNLNYFAIFGFKKHENSYMHTGISHSNLSNINLNKDWLELKYSNVATDNFDTACPCFQVLNNVDNLILEVKDIQIEEADASTLYEPYQEDKTQILLDEPLMRLPNGVCDEITRDGKLIRRIRKIVFTGDETESWIKKNNYGDVTRFDIELADIKPMGDIFSDTFVKGDISSPDKEFINIHGFSKLLQIQIKTSKITSDSVSGFKEWLSRNYVTAYYELETPTIIELPAPYLRIFKDGHLTFNTLVAPESNHVVQLNKSAQIERSIREVQSLDNRVGRLESFYDDMMLETSHKLNLLTYDFEYTKESEDI